MSVKFCSCNLSGTHSSVSNIYLSSCLSVCMYESSERPGRWTNPHQIWYGGLTLQGPGHRLCFGPRGGPPGPHKIQGIGAGFIPAIFRPELIDEVIIVDDTEAFAHCGKFPTAASRRSLDRVSVPVCLIILSNQILIVALVSHYLTN